MTCTLLRVLLPALCGLPLSASAFDAIVDERSLEFDASGRAVRASGEVVAGPTPIGRFAMKLSPSDAPGERGSLSIDLEGAFAGSLKATLEQRHQGRERDASGAPLAIDPGIETANRAFYDALRPTATSPSLWIYRLICATSIGFSDTSDFCQQLGRTPLDFPHLLPDPIGSIPSHFPLTPVEQSLFGCGPLWTTDCADEGVDLFLSDLETLLYFLPGGLGAGQLAHGEDEDAVLAVGREFASALVALGTEDRFGPGPCGLETPENCHEVRRLLDRVVTPLAGGPRRWLWETGARFRIGSSTGYPALAYRTGVVYASEPFVRRDDRIGITLIPVPEPEATRLAVLVAVLVAVRRFRTDTRAPLGPGLRSAWRQGSFRGLERR